LNFSLGKTSTVIACAKKMYGDNQYAAMTLELNASDDRGIDVVREQIKEFAGTKKLWSNEQKGIKLIILDEADSMTSEAQAALRRGKINIVIIIIIKNVYIVLLTLHYNIVIEKYTSNTRFCLICNFVNKIIPALQSRCTK
jgi:replication factor C subunit 3/5